MHTDHNTPSNDVNPEAIKIGHEPDKVNARTILYVPIALVITFALAFGCVTLIFDYVRDPATGTMPSTNVVAAARHDAPLNDRLTRIGEQQQDDSVSRQPRLDGLNRLQTGGAPPFQRSAQPTAEGNSPDYYPEDMRPSSGHGKDLGLQDFSWKDKEKEIVRIPIADALKILADGSNDKDGAAAAKKLYQKALKFEDKVNPQEIQASKPKASNPAWGVKSAEPKTESKGGGH